MAVRARARTAEDLWDLADDGMRYELVRGELCVMVPPGAEHGRVAATVAGLLFVHTRETGAGITFAAETGFLLARDPDSVRAPDAAFVTSARAEAVGRTEQYWPGGPDFVAEVVSPGDTFADVEAKALDWLAAGTKLVLVVNPTRRTATTYRGPGDVQVHTGDALLDLGDAVPGWQVGLAELFR
ncbi:MAG TPA: Uma2 family endonuclease [Solirubrobacteraceae bacterium]|nr:Uma2 family endonuclease [Solirubrobacteraceae bacterium]